MKAIGGQDELVLSGNLAGKTIRVWQRNKNGRPLYQFGIIGKGWKYYCLFHPTTAEECFASAVSVLRDRHPKAYLYGPYNEV